MQTQFLGSDPVESLRVSGLQMFLPVQFSYTSNSVLSTSQVHIAGFVSCDCGGLSQTSGYEQKLGWVEELSTRS